MSSTREDTLSSFRAEDQRVLPFEKISGDISLSRASWLHLPARAWLRVLLLFGVLCGFKLALLAQLGKHLFEAHWRLYPRSVRISDYVLFGFFVLLGSLALVRLARCCHKKLGGRPVRFVNLAVLLLGAVFLFLTFHQAGNNYIYPVLTGVLGGKSLVPYLLDDLFFNPPFLGAWMGAYAAIYYVLARAGKESLVLYVTAAFAAAYGALNLADLVNLPGELLIVDCLGAITLFSSARFVNRGSSAWLWMPLGWVLFGAGQFFWLMDRQDRMPIAYFAGLLALAVIVFVIAAVLTRKAGISPFWNRMLPFFAAAFLLLGNSWYPMAPNFNHALCLGLELPRYFLGEVLVGITLFLLAAVYLRFRPRGSLWWVDVFGLFLIAVTLVDFLLSQVLGTRLEWSVLAMGHDFKMIWRMARPYLGGALAGIAGMTALYFGLLFAMNCWWKRRDRTKANEPTYSSLAWSTPGYVAIIFAALGILGLATASPDKALNQAAFRLALTSPIVKAVTARSMKPEEFRGTASELGIATSGMPSVQLPGRRRDLNVVLVFMESSYNKHLSLFSGEEDTQPLLSRYRDRMELFPNFFSTFASSIHARFSTFCSLYPVRDYNDFTLRRVAVKSIFEVLHENGYATSMFYSSYLDFTGFRDLLANRGIDETYDAETMPGQRHSERLSWGLREDETLGAMRERIRQYAANGQRFFLTYVPAAPHYPYDGIPKQFCKFKLGEMGDYKPLYLNDLLYMDWVIASLIDELKASNLLDKTLVIITDDHGEMLGGKGEPIGHGWRLTPELANAPLILMDPDKTGARINTTIGSQVDLLPTVLSRLGLPSPQDQIYQGCSLDNVVTTNRTIYLNTFQQYAILQGNQMIFGDRSKEGGDATITGDCYAIENEGSRTIFRPLPPAPMPHRIVQFDAFQENLLRNYTEYAKAAHQGQPLAHAER